MLMVSASFADCVSVGSTATSNPQPCVYYNGTYFTNPILYDSGTNIICPTCTSNIGKILKIGSNSFQIISILQTYETGYHNTRIDSYRYQTTSSTPPITCTADQDLVAGICVPKCPSGQTVGTDGRCSAPCSTGSHWDYNATVPSCVGDIKYGEKIQMDSGSYYVSFYDGALMYCRTDGKCTTMDQNGNVIDNRWYEGSIPSAPNVYTDLFNDALTLTGNLVGKTLQFAGYTLGLSSSGGGLLLDNTGVLGAINPGVITGAGLVTLGNLLVSDSEKIVMTPKDNSPMNVNIVTNSSTPSDSFDSVSSKTPADGSPVFSQNGLYTYKQITDANLKTVWDTAAGVGTLPPNSLVRGSDIIYPSNNPNTAIINSPTQVEIIKTNPDNTAQSVVINKTDLANTAKNGTDLPYVAKDYAAPQINNNGTVTQPVTSTPSATSPKTNNSTSTNPTTGQTTTQNAANASGVANTSDGKSIDLSGVKGSIDQLGNQLNKLNSSSEAGNGILNGIKSDTGSMKGSLNGISDSFDSIKSLLNDTDVPTTSHSIPKDTSAADWNSWKSTWENAKSSFDGVSSQIDEFSSLFQNGFTLNLVNSNITQCPYDLTLDLVFIQVPISFDFCQVFSPLRNVIYTFFYLLFSFYIISFSVKMFLRMV